MADSTAKTLNDLLSQTRRVRTVFWGRTIDDLGPAALQVLLAVKVAKTDKDRTAGALAEAIGIAPPAASTELTRLAGSGYVTRQKLSDDERGEGDGKVHHLVQVTRLTEQGEAVIASLLDKTREYDRR